MQAIRIESAARQPRTSMRDATNPGFKLGEPIQDPVRDLTSTPVS